MVTRLKAPASQPPAAKKLPAASTRRRAETSKKSAVNRSVQDSSSLVGDERMSKVDTAWLRMDSPANLMMIVGIWLLKPGITHAALTQRVAERLVPYDRFTQRVEEDAGGATWVRDPVFSVKRHVVREVLSSRVDLTPRAALQQRVAELAMQPLDRRHPLWKIHLVESHEGGSVLIARIHHCIADGIALITVMMSMVDGGNAPSKRTPRFNSDDSPHEGPNAWLAESVVRPFTQMAVMALDAAGDGVVRSLGAVASPGQELEGLLHGGAGLARMGKQVLNDLAALALMPDDARTSLKAKPSAEKAVAWCEPLPLADVKAVSKALGCSVNDVLLSCVAGALGAYLKQRGEPVDGQDIRAMVPVNLRPLDQAWKLGNRFGLVPLVLPVGISNPVERLETVRSRMAALKGSTQPLLAFGLLAMAGFLVRPAQAALMGLFSRKATAVMTNVPGPAEKLTFCGSTLEQTLFWVPQSGEIGMGVSILSYGGGVQFGLITDTAVCAEPQLIIDQFAPQFEQLLWLSLMLPYGGWDH